MQTLDATILDESAVFENVKVEKELIFGFPPYLANERSDNRAR